METIKIGGLQFKVRNKRDEEILKGEVKDDLYRIPKAMKVAIDIGAHLGGTAIKCAERGAMVYAYEPNKQNFELLVENVKLNHFEKRIKCFNIAVDADRGQRRLYISDTDSGCHSFDSKGLNQEKFQTVKTIKLDDVMDLNNLVEVDFMKLDCEGAEYNIITKALQPTLYKVKQISMEFHEKLLDKWQLDEIVKWIGYRWDCHKKLYYHFYKK